MIQKRPVTDSGEKNYITPAGFKRLQDEFSTLKHDERPKVVDVVAWAASNGDRSENADYKYGKQRLREIDRRLGFLSRRLEIAEIVDPTEIVSDQVRFGATVTIADEEGREKTYAIVGADESDPDKGKISWVSPIARAMLKGKAGDFVTFQSPQGEREIEILKVVYKPIE